MLHDFIAAHRDEIIRRCRAKVATRSFPPPTEAEIDHGVPVFLGQLQGQLLHATTSTPDIGQTARLHGRDLLLQGFTVSQVVHDYGDVCQAITDLAVELDAPISTGDFRTLNRCLDDAIAGAVTEFGWQRSQTAHHEEVARAGFQAHEVRNLVNTALAAFEALRAGNIGIAGSTGAVLHRSLTGLRRSASHTIAEVRLDQNMQHHVPFEVSTFIAEVAAGATLEADQRRLTLDVQPVEDGIMIDADRQVLAAVVHNLLQNAFKFTRPQTTVTLRVGASDQRVLIEIEDECGGLPSGHPTDGFRPFEQRSSDRTGLGLGLAFSRRGVEATGGRMYARNLPQKGCIFTVDLPRFPTPAVDAVESSTLSDTLV